MSWFTTSGRAAPQVPRPLACIRETGGRRWTESGRPGSERGFSLIELLVAVALIATITGTGALALRHHYRAQALVAAQRTIAVELRQVQQRSMAESYPNAYGARFTKGSATWAVVRLNTKTGTCSVVSTHTLTDGVAISGSGTTFADAVGSTACVNASPGASPANVVTFFYPSGTAEAGSVALSQGARLRTVSVSKLTGRVTTE